MAVSPTPPLARDPYTWTFTAFALDGTSQQLLAANPYRKALRIQNPAANGTVRYRLDGEAVTDATGLPVPADGQDVLDSGHAGTAAVTVKGTNGQTVNVWEAV